MRIPPVSALLNSSVSPAFSTGWRRRGLPVTSGQCCQEQEEEWQCCVARVCGCMPRAARVAYHGIRGQRPRQQLFRLLERAHVRRWIATDERCTRQTMLFVLQFAYSFSLCSKCFPPHLPDEECHSAATSWMRKCISARSRRTACGAQRADTSTPAVAFPNLCVHRGKLGGAPRDLNAPETPTTLRRG